MSAAGGLRPRDPAQLPEATSSYNRSHRGGPPRTTSAGLCNATGARGERLAAVQLGEVLGEVVLIACAGEDQHVDHAAQVLVADIPDRLLNGLNVPLAGKVGYLVDPLDALVDKRGSTWTVVYDEGQDEHGKRRQRSKGGFATKREASAFLTDTLAKLGDGSYTQPSKLTLGEFLSDEWLPAVEGTLRPLSRTQYEQVIRLRVKPNIGQVRLQALSGGHLNGLYSELEQAGLSVSTRRLTHAVVHRALRDAVRWGRLARNPADMADPPALPRTRVQAWTAGELRRFLEHVHDDRLFALWRLAATTGMRRGELLGVTWRALDLDADRLSVEQQLVPTRGGVTFGPPKSARSRRTVALDAETVEALRVHQETQLLERDFAGDAYVDRDLVFANALGGPIHPQRLTQWFGEQRKAAGIPSGTLHVLRHTAATLALTSGVPVHIVAARLGDDAKTVLGTYAHLLPQSDELAAARVAAALAPR